MMRVLVVEDEVKMASLIRRGLREEGLAATSRPRARTRSGWPARPTTTRSSSTSCCPGIDGFETCRRLRADGIWAPVLMLTARDGVEDRVAGPRRRRRRLPHQAVLVRGAARAPAGAGAARRGGAAVRAHRRRPAARPGDPPGLARARRRSSCRRRSSRSWRRSCGGPARCCRATSCSSTRGTTSTRTAPTSSTSTCATCARRSTGRSAAQSIETVRGAGYRLRDRPRRASAS